MYGELIFTKKKCNLNLTELKRQRDLSLPLNRKSEAGWLLCSQAIPKIVSRFHYT